MDAASPTTSVPSRSITLAGVFNFRDLGGYETADGRTTRWRTLFRADGLDRLTADDVDVLRPFGLRTVLDLRMAHELEERGRFPVDAYPVAFHHVSVLDRTWDREQALATELPAADFLHERYTEMLAEAGDRYADAIRLLATPGALPAVFHCAAGKDRTGLLAMLLLGAVGVGHDDIVEDYALTSVTMEAFKAAAAARAPEGVDPAEALAEVPQLFWAADPLAMARVVADIEAAHGSIRGYLRSLGVDDATFAALEDQLLDD
jgi:protein-tyrosine phosphatase